MPWVKLDENFADHPKVERVGPLAAWLHVAALCYCSRHLTDGRIPKAKAVRLADIPNPADHVSALVTEGLWADAGTDYVIHDYLDYQPSRDSVLAERSAARDRMAKKRSAARSPEVPPNKNGSSASPSRPVDSSHSTRPQVTHEDDEISTSSVPDETWDHYAKLKLGQQTGIRNPQPWLAKCRRNARTELEEQAQTWWAMFELDPRRLAQALVDGHAPRNVPRRQETP